MKKIVFIAVIFFVLPVMAYTTYWLFPDASNQGYQPVQPLPYSHKLHAGDLKIPCLYCHTNAERSVHATVPGVGICMNCHRVVKTESPKIQMIKKAFDEGKPIEWIRIHELPDHARFTHKRHVQAGVACQTCHGPIETMDEGKNRVEQFAPLTMGWCLDCHRGKTTPSEVLRHFYPNDPDPRGKPVAPTNCATCHY